MIPGAPPKKLEEVAYRVKPKLIAELARPVAEIIKCLVAHKFITVLLSQELISLRMIFKYLACLALLPLIAIASPREDALCGKFSVTDVSPYIDDKNNQLTIVIPDGMVTAKRMAMPRNAFILKNIFRNEMASYFIKRERWSPLEIGVVGMESYSVKCSGVDNYVLWVSQSNVTVKRMEKWF